MSAELTIYIVDIHDETGMQTRGQVVYCEGREAVQGRTHETMWALRARTCRGCSVRNDTIHFQQNILNVRIILCSDSHGRIFEQCNATLEVGNLLDAQLAFLCHSYRKPVSFSTFLI